MGQPITVTVRTGSRPEVRILTANRSVTGMEIEVYGDAEAAAGDRPPDVLARRLLAAGATKVTVYSNVVTVEAPTGAWGTLEAEARHLVEHLFEFYGDDAGWSFAARGVEPGESKVG